MDKTVRKITSLQKIKNNIWIYLAIKQNIIKKKKRKLGNVFFFWQIYNYVILVKIAQFFKNGQHFLYHLEKQIKMRCKDCIKFRHKKNPTQN